MVDFGLQIAEYHLDTTRRFSYTPSKIIYKGYCFVRAFLEIHRADLLIE